MSILGLTSGKTFADKGFHSANNRRQIFHAFPTGAATLTGLLSLMMDEPTDNPEFGWFEKRYVQIETITGNAAVFSPAGTNDTSAEITLNKGGIYRVLVADSTAFKETHLVLVNDVAVDGGTTNVQGIVTSIIDATHIEVRMTEKVTTVNNTAAGAGNRPVQQIGTANSEGALSSTGRLICPSNPSNHTQIFRDAIYFTSTSLKMPANFDKTGLYVEKSKDASIDHMTGIEKAFLFGQKSIQNVPHPITGELVPMRTTGGLLWYLQEWEKVNGGVFGYREGAAAITSNDDDLKRIIKIPGAGSVTWGFLNNLFERVFRKTNNRAFEKLALCGNGALGAINALLECGILTHNKSMGAESTYGMNVVSVETLYGTIHFKTHPLFNEDANLRYSMLITDVGNLKYRALNDRDTTLLDNRQQNDEDGRKDEWLTECGLEVRFPESHMFITNLREVTKD